MHNTNPIDGRYWTILLTSVHYLNGCLLIVCVSMRVKLTMAMICDKPRV